MRRREKGFVLVTTLLVVALLLILGLAMVSMSSSVSKTRAQERYQRLAQAHARMALFIALGELQKYLGPDQRVSANAAILDADPSTEEIEGVEHPNLLGVWRNTTDSGFHLIGKDVEGGGEVYGAKGYYKDLRFSDALYDEGKWKENRRLTWLASFQGDRHQAHQKLLDENRKVTLIGEGTLGKTMRESQPKRFDQEKLRVEKIDITGASGAFAWAVIDHSQKAVVTKKGQGDSRMGVALRDRIEGVGEVDSPLLGAYKKKYTALEKQVEISSQETVSYHSIGLAAQSSKQLQQRFGEDYNHFTYASIGLFADPIYGGIKKDLTPLLFGRPQLSSLGFESPSAATAEQSFESGYPIIPGVEHLAHGPSFDALRYWGRLKYRTGLADFKVAADTTIEVESMRQRPAHLWRSGMNDGYTFRAPEWAGSAPKLFPVMTDARFHYYFGLTGKQSNNRLRTHIVPRVCLWNPYNVDLDVSRLVVLMPNFFYGNGTFHFVFEESEVERMQALYPDDKSMQRWEGKMRMWCRGLFPNSRFLVFTLEPTTIEAGQCLVFSPKVQTGEHAAGVFIERYSESNVLENVLSAEALQGESHYYYDTVDLSESPLQTSEKWDALRLEEIKHYEPWVVDFDNFNFALKAEQGGTVSTPQTAHQITSSPQFYTLQLLNGGNGGANSYPFWYYSSWIGNSQIASGNQFGHLQYFGDNPYKNPPATHQIGAKMLWFDESGAEANAPPLRNSKWGADHVAYHPTPIAHWTVRPQVITRSPASLCTHDWYTNSMGAWMTQYAPFSPRAFEDYPIRNVKGKFVKFPFGAASDFSSIDSVVLFDVPNSAEGVLSLGALRHASLSPYSWHPTYVIGSSYADLHAPLGATAHEISAGSLTLGSQWDFLIGAAPPGSKLWGLKSNPAESGGLLQIGDDAESVMIGGKVVDTADEILAYDIVFETNQNLWDSFFLSGLDLKGAGNTFIQSPLEQKHLLNQRFQRNENASEGQHVLEKLLTSDDGLQHAFWNAGYMLKNGSSFNVNSTSVLAWTAFLSGLRSQPHTLRGGVVVSASGESIFSRYRRPISVSRDGDPNTVNGWGGGRMLEDAQIAALAFAIVAEVKKRGPFISLADMVNRRLVPVDAEGAELDSTALKGTIEAAIAKAELNSASFQQGVWKQSTNVHLNNNKSEFQQYFTEKLAESKAWGIPGFLTQADILEPLVPAMSVRGDTFTIRCYGEAREGSEIRARTYLEAVVIRSPSYMEAAVLGMPQEGVNLPTDAALLRSYVDGSVKEGNLTPVNRLYGRRFKVQSMRWLSPQEI